MTRRVDSASTASAPAVMSRVPPSSVIIPFAASVSLVVLMPSPPALIVMVPAFTVTLSRPSSPSSFASTTMVPPEIVRSSLVAMPLLYEARTVSCPPRRS